MSNASPYSGAVLKRSAVHFLIGKVVSAVLTLTILLWLVRLLTVAEYGTYVALVAGVELALVITSFGLPWIAARYFPEFRMHANGKQLARFTWQIIALIWLFVISGATLIFIAMPWLLVPMKLGQQIDVARLYLLVLVVEGSRRNMQECILEPLLQQAQAQFSQVLRNLALLACLGVMVIQDTVDLQHVVLAELAGTTLGSASVLYGVIRYLRMHRDLPGAEGWRPPRWLDMWRTARHMYLSCLVNMTYSQPAFIFLTQRFLGVETTALFGFLLNLYGQIYRYLPANLLFGLIRPKLIASYVGEGGMAQLMRNANLVGKMSLFVLMPLLVFAWLTGGELLSLLSGGKFTQSGYYLGGMLLMLIPLSQRQILETVAVACGQSHLCFWGSMFGILTLPLAYWLLELGQGLWSPILAMIVGQIIFNSTLIGAMRLTTTYRPDTGGLFKLMAAAVMEFVLITLVIIDWTDSLQLNANDAVGFLINVRALVYEFLSQQIIVPAHGWLDLSIIAAIALSLFLLTSYFFKPFRAEERTRLNRLLPRNVFVW
ncbi:MAG: lipopolysaccharide biosynthesis protein [Methylobacter sp.]